VSFLLAEVHPFKSTIKVASTVWAETDGGIVAEPTFHIPTETCQQLMDELWAIGVRPSDNGSPGQIEALKKHMEDLRIVAFHALKIPKVK
jgi:hypothetical protein